MIPTSEDTVIYVLCPSHIVTGGIEAVHQLVDKLRKFGHDARIVPLPGVSNPLLLQYRNYDVAFADGVEDHSKNILITTEVNPKQLDHYVSIRKALWWLSVDNHEKLSEKFDFSDPANAAVSHFAQSAYARNFLEGKHVSTVYQLSDYLHQEYLRRAPLKKQHLVLFTPIKGAEAFVDRVMKLDPSIQWLPLKGMIRKMHAKTLRQGKVYVDFGSHPGKDRQPREAVVNGCCVIVGLRGSANFPADLPIPDRYKFPLDPPDEAAILSTIKDCLLNHARRLDEFGTYAASVRREEACFEQEVLAIFGAKKVAQSSTQLNAIRNTFRFVQQNRPPQAIRALANEMLPLEVTNLARRVYRSMQAKASMRD